MKEYKYKINGNVYKVAVGDIDNNIAQVEVNGTPYRVELEPAKKPTTIINTPRPAAAPRNEAGGKVIAENKPAAKPAYSVTAPLPGTVLSITVKVGDVVKAADTVLILEAMKMENSIHAGRDGKVAAINVAPGDAVLEGAPLIVLE